MSVPKFPSGRLVATPGAIREVPPEEVLTALTRHARGDWGEVDAADRHANDNALIQGTRLAFAYISIAGTRFSISSEADRSSTRILLPEEY